MCPASSCPLNAWGSGQGPRALLGGTGAGEMGLGVLKALSSKLKYLLE